MASDVLSLFTMPTQEQIGQSYLQGMMTSPAQMGSQGLLQQVVSLGGNAGAGLGYGVGRLMGGMTADEVRAKGIDDAMRSVQGMGLTSDAEMYGALSQELARRGLTQDALMARNTALKAAQTEQTMRTEQARLGIAQEELGLRQAAEKRAAEKFPLEMQKLRDELTPLQVQLQEAALQEEELRSNPNSPEYRKALAKVTDLSTQVQDKRNKLSMEEQKNAAYIQHLANQDKNAAINAQAALTRAGQERVAGSIGAVPYTDLTGKLTMVPLGRGAGNKIIGSGTGASYTSEEWATFGAMKEEDALKKKLKIQEEDTGGGDKNKNKGKDMQSVLNSIYSGQTAQVTTPQTIEGYQARTGQPIREPGESGTAYRDRVLAWDRARQEELNRQRLIQEEALRQQRLQQGAQMLSNRPLVQ